MLIILINYFVTLKKIPNILTVVNKTDIIDSTYRFFKMEILAGENNMIAEVVCLE
jgi:tRNA (guanine37-N1)-methyltransferase